ncbi:zinc knuckle protein [Trichinella spiralis]|uniref:zinc knuckle protein n=1 Tax=Trichinella spiralis TaxID=6334 RepID=UPI0001EFD1B5|nr:zinc knuckle protein [Trichinella spiralis]
MGILLRFCRFRVGLHPEERDACRFLWGDARGGKAPKEYRLTRVLVRRSSLFRPSGRMLRGFSMRIDCLEHVCRRSGHQLRQHRGGERFGRGVKNLFAKGGFNLTGFMSNCSDVVGYDETLPFGKDPKPAGRLWKTLGVLWDTKSDRLSFQQPEVDMEAQDTKRILLILAATVFDPLGYLTPFTVRAFGGVSEKALACAFVAGLPENVRQLLRAGSRMEDLRLSQILTRARAIITDERPVDAPNTCLSARGPEVRSPTAPPGQRCFECGGPNHFALDCLARRQGGDPARQNPPTRNRRGRRRGVVSAASHQGNELRTEASAPAFCPRDH